MARCTIFSSPPYNMIDLPTQFPSAVSTTEVIDTVSCPQNMIYTECSCQKTCQNPINCSTIHQCSGYSCICPEGFFLQEGACVAQEECGCFFEEYIVPADSVAVHSDCSKRCMCTNDALVCDANYQCDPLATCEADSNGMMGCQCLPGFYGDGIKCHVEPTDCLDLYTSGNVEDGTYTIKPLAWLDAAFEVHCQMTDPEGPWLVFQRRVDGATGFNRGWTVYKDGIAGTSNEIWIGNEKLFYITNQRPYELRIDFSDGEGFPYYVTYDHFSIGDSNDHYRLIKLGTHDGNAADALRSAVGHAFSTTFDDNDDWSDDQCDYKRNGGWWYRPGESGPCFASNLNGEYNSRTDTGISWGEKTQIKFAEMKLRSKH